MNRPYMTRQAILLKNMKSLSLMNEYLRTKFPSNEPTEHDESVCRRRESENSLAGGKKRKKIWIIEILVCLENLTSYGKMTQKMQTRHTRKK